MDNLVKQLRKRADYLDNLSSFISTGELEREVAYEIERLTTAMKCVHDLLEHYNATRRYSDFLAAMEAAKEGSMKR